MSALPLVARPVDCMARFLRCAPGGPNRPERPPIRRAFVVVECVAPSMGDGTEPEEEAMQYEHMPFSADARADGSLDLDALQSR